MEKNEKSLIFYKKVLTNVERRYIIRVKIKDLEDKTMMNFDAMVDMIKAAYISLYGAEKWNSLTDKEKHDAVVLIAKDFSKALD